MSQTSSARRTLSYSFRYLVLALVALVFVGPLLWMLTASVKGDSEILRYPPTILPTVFRWDNYSRVFQLQPFARQLLNSVLIMSAVCLGTLVVSAMAGYAFARVRPRGSGIFFILILSAIFVPPEATIIPLYRLASSLGWINTPYPLVVFTVFLTTAPIATFVMRQAFLSLPREFEEAATLDGAGRWRTFLQVYLPMVRPSLAAVVVLSVWHSWGQFLEPLVYMRSTSEFTVPLALTQYNDPFAGPLWGVQMAATTLSILPVLIVFLLAQKHVVSGLTAGGLKG